MSRPADVDVCVVGSGAGGSVAAAELAAAGYSVVILEAGVPTRPDLIPTAREDWEHHLFEFFDRASGGDRVTYGPRTPRNFRISRFKGVGGSTMHYEGFYTRMHPGDLSRASEIGLGADWPLTYDDLAPYYDRVEARLGVSGEPDNPFEPPRKPFPNRAVPMSCAVQTMKAGCDRLGLHAAHASMAIITREAGERRPCNYCGGCWFGCMPGAISNAAETYLPDALARGAELRQQSTAVRIVTEPSGRRVAGVEYLDAGGELVLQRASRVVLAGNGVETPRLLLMSAGPGHPDGLGNGSGHVGRYFSAHTHASVAALFDIRVDGFKGPNINGQVQDFWDHDDGRDFAGGYVIALRNAELGPYHHYRQRYRSGRLFGAALYSAMDKTFGRTATISAYGEHFATADDRVTLDGEVTDALGLPAARIDIRHGDNERAMTQHMTTTLRAIMEAAGAVQVDTRPVGSILGTHLMGTCRMGTDPRTSVTDAGGRCHDLDNLYIADGSLFPTSTPANPTLTIQALATRVAHGIAAGDGRPVPS